MAKFFILNTESGNVPTTLLGMPTFWKPILSQDVCYTINTSSLRKQRMNIGQRQSNYSTIAYSDMHPMAGSICQGL